jgi:hypothetical protein
MFFKQETFDQIYRQVKLSAWNFIKSQNAIKFRIDEGAGANS